MRESDVLNTVRLEAAELGIRLWRNNVGCTYTREGSFIRYGLCNESSAVNKVCKSADLIGIRPLLIEWYHVGTIIGQFVSRECKSSDWKPGNTERDRAQVAWRDLILSLGGDAAIVCGVGSL
jgi:hypothetical protein